MGAFKLVLFSHLAQQAYTASRVRSGGCVVQPQCQARCQPLSANLISIFNEWDSLRRGPLPITVLHLITTNKSFQMKSEARWVLPPKSWKWAFGKSFGLFKYTFHQLASQTSLPRQNFLVNKKINPLYVKMRWKSPHHSYVNQVRLVWLYIMY